VGYHRADLSDTPRLRARGDLDGYVLSTWFVDLDTVGHEPWPDRATAETSLHAVVGAVHGTMPLAVAYTTRAGLRLAFALGTPVPCAKARALLAQLVGDLAPLLHDINGVELDATCAEWSRCHRMPTVVRDGVQLAPVIMQLGGTLEVDLGGLAETRPAESLEDVAQGEWVLPDNHATWSMHVRPGTLAHAHMESLLTGAPLAFQVGERNAGLFSLVRSLGGLLSGAWGSRERAAVVYQVLAPCVQAMTGDGAPTIGQLADMIARTVAQDGEPEEPRQCTDVDGLPDLPKGWPAIVRLGGKSAFMVWRDGNYTGPYDRNGMLIAADAEGLPVYDSKGKPLGEVSIIKAMGAMAMGFCGGHKASWDARTHKVTSRLYPTPPPAQYDADVERWLQILMRDSPNGMDWLRRVYSLDLPLPALVLYGPAGTGKSMLMQAVSESWPGGGAAWSRATSAHGLAPLQHNPCVLADEFRGLHSKSEIEVFRSLVANDSHVVNPKGLPELQLSTALRFIATTNTTDAFSVGKASHEDVVAVRQRMVGVHCPLAAADHLARNGGRSFTTDWVRNHNGEPGRIARHVAWMQGQPLAAGHDHRLTVVPGLSPGLERIQGSSDEEQILVAEAVLGALLINHPAVCVDPHDPARVCINVESLHRGWAAFPGCSVTERPSRQKTMAIIQQHQVRSANVEETERLVRSGTTGRPRRYAVVHVPWLESVSAALPDPEHSALLDRALSEGKPVPVGTVGSQHVH
jgi:hypothetical protein